MRTVERTAKFERQLESLAHNVPDLNKAVRGAEFVVARIAEQGPIVGDTRFSSWPLHVSPGVTFKLIYAVEEDRVVLHALFPAVAPPGS